MKRSTAIALAVVAAGVIAAGAYTLGLRSGNLASDRPAAVDAMTETVPSAPSSATPLPAGAVETAAALSDDERAEVEGIIRNYLIANPEIIRDAINELQRRADEAAQLAQTKAINDNADLLFTSADDGVLGNPKGDVTLVEFFDYNCAYCRRAQADMENLIDKDPKLRVVLKEFPVLGDNSVQAARVSVAVLMTAPDKYAAFHDTLLGEPGQVDGTRALAVAKEVGLDPDALSARLDDDDVKARINESYDLAGKLNLTGTPSYVTKKEVIVGAVGYDALKSKIDDARGCDTASC
jgi:protein-disulfide isomerase